MPSSWRQTLADDALRQAMSPASAVLSECYLSGSLPKASASKRQRVRRSSPAGGRSLALTSYFWYVGDSQTGN